MLGITAARIAKPRVDRVASHRSFAPGRSLQESGVAARGVTSDHMQTETLAMFPDPQSAAQDVFRCAWVHPSGHSQRHQQTPTYTNRAREMWPDSIVDAARAHAIRLATLKRSPGSVFELQEGTKMESLCWVGELGAKKRYQLPGLLPTRAWCCGQLPKLEEFPCFGARTWLKLLGRPAISKFEALAQDDCPTTRGLFSNTDSYTSFLESAENRITRIPR